MRPAISPARLWLTWIAANAAGELAGLGVIAIVAVRLHTAGMGPLPFAATLVLLGAYEGAVVGFAQSAVLRRIIPELSARRWTGASIVGAVIAWALGLLPSTASALTAPPAGPELELDVPRTLMMGLTAVGGALAGAILGTAQMIVLRRVVPHAGWWIFANALAWAVSMPLLVAGEMTLGAITTAGAVAGAIHGAVLISLITRPAKEEYA